MTIKEEVRYIHEAKVHSQPKKLKRSDFSMSWCNKNLKKSSILEMSRTFILPNNNAGRRITNLKKNQQVIRKPFFYLNTISWYLLIRINFFRIFLNLEYFFFTRIKDLRIWIYFRSKIPHYSQKVFERTETSRWLNKHRYVAIALKKISNTRISKL